MPPQGIQKQGFLRPVGATAESTPIPSHRDCVFFFVYELDGGGEIQLVRERCDRRNLPPGPPATEREQC